MSQRWVAGHGFLRRGGGGRNSGPLEGTADSRGRRPTSGIPCCADGVRTQQVGCRTRQKRLGYAAPSASALSGMPDVRHVGGLFLPAFRIAPRRAELCSSPAGPTAPAQMDGAGPSRNR